MRHVYPPDVLEFVEQSLQSGDYPTEDEVIFASVRALRELKRKHQALRDDIQAGLDELDAGLGEPWDVAALEAELLASPSLPAPSA